MKSKYRINKKCLAVARIMPRGKVDDQSQRLKYLHIGPKGVTALQPDAMCRVSLPAGNTETLPVILPEDRVDDLRKRTDAFAGPISKYEPEVEVDGVLPAATSPDHLVPKVDDYIPDPSKQAASITVNGQLLLKMLKVVTEVSEDSNRTLRLRVCPEDGVLRIDTYRQPGEQEFVGVIREMEYNGDFIPGDRPSNAPKVVEEKPKVQSFVLKVEEGRKFRA